MFRSGEACIEKGSDEKLIYYPLGKDNESINIVYDEFDGYISHIGVVADFSIFEESDEDTKWGLSAVMAAPTTMLIDDLGKYNIETYFDAVSELADELMESESGYFHKYGMEYDMLDGSFVGMERTALSCNPLGFNSEN